MKRLFLSILMALLCLGALVPVASADYEWECDTDPTVVISTPGGNTVVVHVTDSAQDSVHLAALRAVAISYTTQAVTGQPATDVEIQVTVPDDQYETNFPVRSVASTQPFRAGTVLASADGKSGQTLKLRFRLDVA